MRCASLDGAAPPDWRGGATAPGAYACADEVRIVVEGDVGDFCRDMRRRIRAAHYFLSPCERGGVCNVEVTIRLLGVLNRGRRSGHWLLSMQTHKLTRPPVWV
jgi:hypothetical protein